MRPVIVSNGSQKYPLVRGYTGDGGLGGGGFGSPILPRLADDPCVCCPEGGGICGSPCPSCSECYSQIHGVSVVVSGTRASSCEPNAVPGEPRLVYNSLDGVYLCTRYDGISVAGKRFTCVLGAGTCANPGILEMTAGVGGPNPVNSYIVELLVIVRCGGSGIEVTGVIPTGVNYLPNCERTSVPYGSQLIYGVFSAPWPSMCNEGGSAVLTQNITTVCNRTPYPVSLTATLL